MNAEFKELLKNIDSCSGVNNASGISEVLILKHKLNGSKLNDICLCF